MIVLLFMVMYIIEILKYERASKLFLDKGIKIKWVWYALCFVLIICLYYITKVEMDYVWILMYVSVLGVTYIQMSGNRIDNKKELVTLFLILSCCDEVFFSILNGYFKIRSIFVPVLFKLYMITISSVCVYFLILLLIFFKDKIDKCFFAIKIQNKMQYTVYFMEVCILLTIALLEYSTDIIKNYLYQIVVVFFSILAYIAVEVLLLLSFYLKKSNYVLEEKMIRKQKFYIMEKKYYELMLERETETKRMRHDLHNHYICMESLLESGDFDSLKDYLDQLSQKLYDIKKTSYFTGNQILDAITNYYAQMLSPNISFELYGKTYHELKLNNMDLCTIYSNILENAVEELQKIKGKGFLKITINSGNEYTQISVENTTNTKVQSLHTTKKDEFEHGIGLQNVQEVIERCQGRIQYEIKEQSFCVKVVF